MSLQNVFGAIALEQTQQQVKALIESLGTEATLSQVLANLAPLGKDASLLAIEQALAPAATEVTLAAAKALLENAATELTLSQVKTILQSIQANSADKNVTLVNPQDTFDSGEREIPSVAMLVISQGDTLLKAPAPGKRLVLRWIYAVNKPTAASSPLINIRMGDKPLYTVWAVSKRQLFVGDIDAPLFINLSEPGEVALTALVEEV